MSKPVHQLLFPMFVLTRRSMYLMLGFLDRSVLHKSNQIFVLSYHSVSKDDWRFSVNPETIKQQISYLKKSYDIISLKDLQAYISGKKSIAKPSVVITFDDGYKDILTLKSFFDKNGIKPALFLLADTKKANWQELGSKRPFLNKREIHSLVKSGWEIGCHSATHANLATLSQKELTNEIITAKKTLEKQLGIPMQYFAYPRGKYTKDVLQTVKKAGYKLALTMDDGFIQKKSNVLTLPRIGIDRSHTFSEFKTAFSPSVVHIRKAVKQTIVGKYL